MPPLLATTVTAPPCTECRTGCGCVPTDPGCAHYGCWGRRPTGDCSGVAYELARLAALEAARERQQRAEAVRRAHHANAYLRVVHDLHRFPKP